MIAIVAFLYLKQIMLEVMHMNSGNAYKLVELRAKLDVRNFSFTCRVVDIWNSLNNFFIACINLKVL